MLAIERTSKGYRLVGDIDEAADFSAIPDEDLELDLASVRRINSTGIKRWIRWKDRRSERLTLRNVPCRVVLELSVLPELCRGHRIHSVRAPYCDVRSGATTEILFDASALASLRSSRAVPKMTSPEGNELEFDEDQHSYFGFLWSGASLVGDPG